jgi:hypothetical protein
VTRRRRGWIAAGVGLLVVGAGSVAALAGLGARGGGALPAPHYVEEAAAAGLDHAYTGDFFYYVGGGVAAFDCDGDGRQDLYLAGGEAPAALFRNRSPVGGALAFDPVASPVTDLTGVVGAYPLDIDADGNVDLAVLRLGENVLLRGLGGCSFERANEAWRFDGGDAWTTAFSASWEHPTALPTLAFGNYLKPDTVGDGSYVCDEDQLVRPDASGRQYAAPTTLSPSYCTLSMLFSDWDRSGRRDLRVSNDRHYYRFGEEQLWRTAPDAAPRLYTAAEGWQPVHIWGMGIASYDLDGDGYPEIYLTSQADNRLQTLADGPGQPRYRDIAVERGATAHEPYAGDVQKRSTAWHAEFADVNNDGDIDLFVAKGNVEAMPDYAMRDPSNLLIGQADGTYVEGGQDAGIVSFARARGAALADFNLDGMLDLVIVNRRQNVGLYRNVGSGTANDPQPMGHWLAIRLQQDGANRDAIGAWVEVTAGDRVLRREVTVGGGHAGGQLGWIHFGLGDAESASVRVIWPDGERGPAMPAVADAFGIVTRGSTGIEPWTPPQ